MTGYLHISMRKSGSGFMGKPVPILRFFPDNCKIDINFGSRLLTFAYSFEIIQKNMAILQWVTGDCRNITNYL